MPKDNLIERLEERKSSDDCPFRTHCYCDIEPPHGSLFNRDGPEAAALIEEMVEGLRQWKCPSCGGSKVYTQRGRDRTAVIETREVPCKVCEQSGLNLIARSLITKATEGGVTSTPEQKP
jgi:hypothetical protein